ncbi:uncharacterized protein LOC141920636 isoform X2 [Strix aluco]|uniref:uncharacterized protein LOC141920636 isoform X2 n=1 Tax=Strix aluco TaxID=111821 RepID=UPI003DA28C21
MAAVAERTDELVREYLLFRGFAAALKQLDAEVKADREKGFRVGGGRVPPLGGALGAGAPRGGRGPRAGRGRPSAHPLPGPGEGSELGGGGAPLGAPALPRGGSSSPGRPLSPRPPWVGRRGPAGRAGGTPRIPVAGAAARPCRRLCRRSLPARGYWPGEGFPPAWLRSGVSVGQQRWATGSSPSPGSLRSQRLPFPARRSARPVRNRRLLTLRPTCKPPENFQHRAERNGEDASTRGQRLEDIYLRGGG